jgi:hypothetical protein
MKNIVNSKFKNNLSSNLSRSLIKNQSKGIRSTAGITSYGLNNHLIDIVHIINLSKM